jgi:Mg-chelatase subunit ChlI
MFLSQYQHKNNNNNVIYFEIPVATCRRRRANSTKSDEATRPWNRRLRKNIHQPTTKQPTKQQTNQQAKQQTNKQNKQTKTNKQKHTFASSGLKVGR